MAKVTLIYPETGLDISISIKHRITFDEDFSGTMTEIGNGSYIFDFVEIEDTDYIYVATVAGYDNLIGVMYEEITLTDEETEKLMNIEKYVDAELTLKHGTGQWISGGAYIDGSGGSGGLSIEQLNHGLERLIGHIDKAKKDLSKDIGDSTKATETVSAEVSSLAKICQDLGAASVLQDSPTVNVEIDYQRIIQEMNSFKSSTKDDTIKDDIRTLLSKMDAYKQLDINDIIEAINSRIDVPTDLSEEVIKAFKDSFCIIEDQIKELKESGKVKDQDKEKITTDVYDLLKKLEDSGIEGVSLMTDKLLEKLNTIHGDILDIEI